MIALLALVLTTALEYISEHPDLAKALVKEALGVVDQITEHKGEMSVEQQTAIAAGLAAYRANIIQEFVRRKDLRL